METTRELEPGTVHLEVFRIKDQTLLTTLVTSLNSLEELRDADLTIYDSVTQTGVFIATLISVTPTVNLVDKIIGAFRFEDSFDHTLILEAATERILKFHVAVEVRYINDII